MKRWWQRLRKPLLAPEPCIFSWWDPAVFHHHMCALPVHYSTPHTCHCGETR